MRMCANGGLASALGLWFFVSGLLFLSSAAVKAQPKNPFEAVPELSREEGERRARELVTHLLSQKPTANSTNTGVVRIRDAEGKSRAFPARFGIEVTLTNYSTIYEAAASDAQHEIRLRIIHTDQRPNRSYLTERGGTGEARTTEVSGPRLATPFAGSDFWLADLGFEFLHWPGQRILRYETRGHVSCAVLQSTNSAPMPGGYSRVEAWIGVNSPDEIVLVHADGYDSGGKKLKAFEPRKLEKINGAWQLESMEMLNDQSETRTVIEFNLKPNAP